MSRVSMRMWALAALGLVASVRWWEAASGEDFCWVYAGVLGLLVVLYPLGTYLEGRFEFFEIMNVFIGVYFLNYMLDAWLLYSSDYTSSLSGFIDSTTFCHGLFLASAGLALFYLGYLSPFAHVISRSLPRLNSEFSVERATLVLILVTAVSVGSRVVHAALWGGLASLMRQLIESRASTDIGFGWMSPFLYAGIWGLPLGCVYLVRSRGSKEEETVRRGLLGFVCLILVLVTAIRGGRGIVIGWVITIVVTLYYTRWARLTLSFATPFGLIVVLLAVGIFWLRYWLTEAVMPWRDVVFLTVVQSFSNFEVLLTVLSQYPGSYGFFYGGTIADAVLLPWVPRVIWPSKKLAYGGLEITEQFGGWFASGTSTPADMIGELYANFGDLGVIGMVLHGLIGRSVYLYLVGYQHTRNVGTALLYGLVVGAILYWSRMGFSLYVPTLLDQWLPAFVALSFIHGYRRAASVR